MGVWEYKAPLTRQKRAPVKQEPSLETSKQLLVTPKNPIDHTSGATISGSACSALKEIP